MDEELEKRRSVVKRRATRDLKDFYTWVQTGPTVCLLYNCTTAIPFARFSGPTDLGHSVQDAGRFRHPVVDLSSPPTGVDVGQERSHRGEIRGEAVVYVLLLHRQVLGGDDAVGGHLDSERKRERRRLTTATAEAPRGPLWTPKRLSKKGQKEIAAAPL